MIKSNKPSGASWIGGIPVDWELKKIRFSTTTRTEVGRYTFDDIFIGLENVESSSGKIIEIESEYIEGIYDVFYKGDVLLESRKLRVSLVRSCRLMNGLVTGSLGRIKSNEHHLQKHPHG